MIIALKSKVKVNRLKISIFFVTRSNCKNIELDNLTDEKTEESPRIPQYSTLLISLFPYHADT